MVWAHFGDKPDWVDLKASVVICGPFCPVRWGCKGNRQFGHLYSTNTIPPKYRYTLTTFQRSFTKQLEGRMSTCSPAPFMFSSPWTPGPTHCIGWPALYQTLPFICNTACTQLLTLHAIIKYNSASWVQNRIIFFKNWYGMNWYLVCSSFACIWLVTINYHEIMKNLKYSLLILHNFSMFHFFLT